MNTHTIGVSSPLGGRLPSALRTASNITSTWDAVEVDFDTAADRIIRAHKNDGEHRDLPVSDLRTWAIAPHEGQFALVPLARHHEPRPLRACAFSQLAARLGAPVEFIRRLPAPLQLAALNYLLAEHDENSGVTLRVRNDQISAIVSGRYAPMDAAELMETIRAALERFGVLRDVRVRGVASGLVDNIRLVLPAEQKAIRPGDISMASLDITTSSFARSAIRLGTGAYRLVCANGLVVHQRGSSGFSFRHVGDRDRLRDAVSEAIPSALVHARGVLDQWRRSVTFMVEDVQRQIDSLRELTIPERKNLEAAVIRETGRPEVPAHVLVYDFVNAITASAKEAIPARRLEIEALAGDALARHVGSA